MAFDNRDIKPRKKSYYPFSKNYPGRRSGTSYAIGESRTRKKKEKRKESVFSVFLVFFFVLVFVIAAVSINLSKKPYEAFPPNMTANCALFICPTTFLTAV